MRPLPFSRHRARSSSLNPDLVQPPPPACSSSQVTSPGSTASTSPTRSSPSSSTAAPASAPAPLSTSQSAQATRSERAPFPRATFAPCWDSVTDSPFPCGSGSQPAQLRGIVPGLARAGGPLGSQPGRLTGPPKQESQSGLGDEIKEYSTPAFRCLRRSLVTRLCWWWSVRCVMRMR